MDMMMVNIVSPETGAVQAAGTGTGAQSSDTSGFGEILNAELGQQAVSEADVQADNTQASDSVASAAAAVFVAQFMGAGTTVVPDAAVTAEQTVAFAPQVQGKDSPVMPAAVSVVTPIATDGGPYTDASVPEGSVNTPFQVSGQDVVSVSETGETVGIDVSVMEPVAASVETVADNSGNVVSPDIVSDAGIPDPVFRTVVRESMAQAGSASEPQEQAIPVQVETTANAPAQDTQQVQPDSQVTAPVENAASDVAIPTEFRVANSDSASTRLTDTGAADASVSDIKVESPAQSSGDTNTGSNDSAFSFAGQEQIRANSADTAQAARTEARTEAYSEVQQKVIDQVVREVKLRRFDQGGEIIMRLDPPELGTMRVRITQDAGIMTGHISASSDQVKSLLQSHLSTLVDALSEAGVKMDSVSVSTGMPSGAFGQDNAQNASQNGFNGSRRRFAAAGASSGAGAVAGSVGAFTSNSNVGYSWLA